MVVHRLVPEFGAVNACACLFTSPDDRAKVLNPDERTGRAGKLRDIDL